MISNIHYMKDVKSIRDIDITGKRVLVRVDFNVPMDSHQTMTDDRRIRSALQTINYCIDHNACSITLVSHLGRPKGEYEERFSLRHIQKRLERLLHKRVEFIEDFESSKDEISACSLERVFLLENIRFHPGEKKNDPELSKKLASICDVYVNDAFGTSHRKHASTYGITEFVSEKVAGFLMMKEIICYLFIACIIRPRGLLEEIFPCSILRVICSIPFIWKKACKKLARRAACSCAAIPRPRR